MSAEFTSEERDRKLSLRNRIYSWFLNGGIAGVIAVGAVAVYKIDQLTESNNKLEETQNKLSIKQEKLITRFDMHLEYQREWQSAFLKQMEKIGTKVENIEREEVYEGRRRGEIMGREVPDIEPKTGKKIAYLE